MPSDIQNIDDILIGVFLTAFLIFVVLWSFAMLKWRKKFLYNIFPCFKKKKSQAKNEISQNTNVNISSNPGGKINHSFSARSLTKQKSDNPINHSKISNPIYTIDLNNNQVQTEHVKIEYDSNNISIENEVKL
ncbi:unnamed protein product [Brachionus calyciflorus]|uniref:Uncharacterized protein n=1 Tax=Brachionus calyciflorus TaxID=104777 RepID=A0A813MD49_9BILA|nr:unnamed protein product [Brachionus calyciflorus]